MRLVKVVPATIDVCFTANPVNVEFHQSSIRTLTDDEGHLQPHVCSKLHRHTDCRTDGLPISCRHTLRASCKHSSLFSGYSETLVTIHTADHGCLTVYNVAHTEFKFKRCACSANVAFQGIIVNGSFGAIHQFQGVPNPATGFPVHIFKRRSYSPVAPHARICFLIIPACGIQF